MSYTGSKIFNLPIVLVLSGIYYINFNEFVRPLGVKIFQKQKLICILLIKEQLSSTETNQFEKIAS